jgi:hypothetical protein
LTVPLQDKLIAVARIRAMDDLPVPVAPALPSTITDELTSAATYAQDARAAGTVRAYRSDLRDFVQWRAARRSDPRSALRL